MEQRELIADLGLNLAYDRLPPQPMAPFASEFNHHEYDMAANSFDRFGHSGGAYNTFHDLRGDADLSESSDNSYEPSY